MRIQLMSTLAVLLLQAPSSAQDQWQSAEELQRIREQRLLEWYAQEQQFQQNPQQGNVSLNQPPQAVVPEADDLFAAATSGNISQIANLLSQGLDINISNRERETALHMATARGHYEAVNYLVRQGAYVNAPTVKNWIPLHHAVRFRHHNIAMFLVNRGSSANARTSDGLSAIDMANNVSDYRMLSILGAR